jgi:hypothetical protein
MAKLSQARALIDIDAIGVKCGQVFQADQKTVAGLVKSGQADDDKDAVAYAKTQFKDIVTVADAPSDSQDSIDDTAK